MARIPTIRIEAHNSAAMREALERIVFDIHVEGVKAKSIFSLFHFYEIAKKALAEPPRNCDLINDEDKAFEKFVEEVGEIAGKEAEVAKKVLRVMFAKATGGEETVEI